jgi:hypothetical protein
MMKKVTQKQENMIKVKSMIHIQTEQHQSKQIHTQETEMNDEVI